MAVRGKSGKIYADAVRGKSVSELFRMGYSSWEVNDIKRKRKRFPTRGLGRRLLYCVAALFVLYIGMSVYNGIQENEAEKAVNLHSRIAIGHDVLVNKGVLGHSWTAFTNPSLNFSSVSRSSETRVSYAAYEAYGVWDLIDYRATNADSSPASNGSSDSVDVIIDNDIYHSYSKESGIEAVTHNQYHKEVYTSLVKISFGTDFLIARGFRSGATHELTVSMRYRYNKDEVRTSENTVLHVIVGESTGTTITVKDPDGYVTVSDIVGFNFE